MSVAQMSVMKRLLNHGLIRTGLKMNLEENF